MATQEDIDNLLKLLAAHRRTLTVYLKQQAELGLANTPPNIIHGITEARSQIRRIKEGLRGWEVNVEDYPLDEEAFLEPPKLPLIVVSPAVQPAPSEREFIFSPPNKTSDSDALLDKFLLEYDVENKEARTTTQYVQSVPDSGSNSTYSFTVKKGLLLSSCIFGLLILLAALALLLDGLYREVLEVLFGIMLLAPSAFAFWWFSQNVILLIEVSPEAIEQLHNGNSTKIAWLDVMEILRGRFGSSKENNREFYDDGYHIKSLRGAGISISFGHKFSGLNEFEDCLRKYAVKAMLPRRRLEYHETGSTQFGSVILDRSRGIIHIKNYKVMESSIGPTQYIELYLSPTSNDTSTPWNEIEEIIVADENVKIRRLGRTELRDLGSIGDIPDFFVMQALVNEIIRKR